MGRLDFQESVEVEGVSRLGTAVCMGIYEAIRANEFDTIALSYFVPECGNP